MGTERAGKRDGKGLCSGPLEDLLGGQAIWLALGGRKGGRGRAGGWKASAACGVPATQGCTSSAL